MFKPFVILVFVFAHLFTQAQTGASCCQASATASFAALGSDQEFRSAHMSPRMDTLLEPKGKLIGIATDDEKQAYGYFITATEPTDKILLVFHEWWGLNDNIKRESDKLFEALGGKAHVLAVDLFDYKKATDAEAAAKLTANATDERLTTIIKGAFKLGGEEAKYATLGWCFGGSWSLQASIMAGERSKACVIYYGMPEKDTSKLDSLKAPVLGIFAKKDKWITPQIVSEFEAALKAKGKQVEIHQYDADHAFANPSNPKHDVTITEDAFNKTITFLQKEFLEE
ncbi:MAG: dienelactone hydrolase family protein [Saprospiraceae bacterium]|nr:dienelactone hydrolase family protein [Saprospiraceae bacterium]